VLQNIDIEQLTSKLAAIVGSIIHFIPELTLAGSLILLLIFDLFNKKSREWFLPGLSIAFLVIITLTLAVQWNQVATSGKATLFLGMLTLDSLSIFLKLLFVLAAVFTTLLSFRYISNQEELHRIGEFHVLMYGLLLGAFLMVMSTNLLSIYLAIELVSITSYILTNFDFNKKSAESGLKYLLFGALSSGVMLYGMSLLYGFTGTLDITTTAFANSLLMVPAHPLVIAGILTFGGLFFKIAIFPFHIWSPDVYEGAPTPVVAFFSVVPKLAGLIILIRLLNTFEHVSLAFIDISFSWRELIAIIAILTMIIGNFSALWQTNAKRMLAYSSIAHAGFLLVGVLAYSNFGLHSILFYGFVYLFMNFGAFWLLKILYQKCSSYQMHAYRGLGHKYPYIGILMVICMISLTGLPPTAGFSAKLFIFSALWETYQNTHNNFLFYLIIIGLFNSVISLFYYIKIPYLMFFKHEEIHVSSRVNYYDKILVALVIIPLLILFFRSDILMNFINHIQFSYK
jgi:NADH-quinone oxidoreductase subunit N